MVVSSYWLNGRQTIKVARGEVGSFGMGYPIKVFPETAVSGYRRNCVGERGITMMQSQIVRFYETNYKSLSEGDGRNFYQEF